MEWAIYHAFDVDCEEGYIIEGNNFNMVTYIFCGECFRTHEFVLSEHFFDTKSLFSYLADEENGPFS